MTTARRLGCEEISYDDVWLAELISNYEPLRKEIIIVILCRCLKLAVLSSLEILSFYGFERLCVVVVVVAAVSRNCCFIYAFEVEYVERRRRSVSN